MKVIPIRPVAVAAEGRLAGHAPATATGQPTPDSAAHESAHESAPEIAQEIAQEIEQSLFEVRKKIYPRAVHGWFAGWRWLMVWFTQALFLWHCLARMERTAGSLVRLGRA